ncbi:MAG: NAD-dependent epimerase/dehydratase family protein [Alphaproteobacteria bacterium]|nr:NAD-dependent epimerase/dehydratase family protein [Alphaproteobacteria bacterium]
MHVVITGGAGFIGRRLCLELLRRGQLDRGAGVPARIESITLFDHLPPARPIQDPRVRYLAGDIGDPASVQGAIAAGTDSVFHLAAVVSAEAEANFDLGMRVNLDGTRNVLEACRALPRPPQLVFTSSIATYGGKLPDPVTDETLQTPLTSYGAQKAAAEFLVGDYSRKGFLDGRALRLPTITIRPGKPNRAASTWVSSIMREPLQGEDAVCPVTPETRMACLSPRRCVAALIRAHELPAEALGNSRSILLPGLSVSAREMADAVQRHAGNRRLGRIIWEPDPAIQRIVDGWPKASRSAKAAALGFEGDTSIDEIVKGFIEDELEGQAQ